MLVVSLSFVTHTLLLIGLGLFTGILSGLLGIGGGVIIVPALLMIFHTMGLDPSRVMHYAVGTSLGVMVISTISASAFHLKHEKPKRSLLMKIIPCVCLGVFGGTLLAHFLSTAWLKRLFGLLVLWIAYKMISGKPQHQDQVQHNNLTLANSSVLGSFVGFCSGLLGIGGGVITVPYLLHKHFAYRSAVMVSLLMSLAGSVVGVLFYMLLGTHQNISLSKGFVGDVYLVGVVWIAIGAIPGTFLATKLMPYLSVIWLKRIFAILLFLTAAHLLVP